MIRYRYIFPFALLIVFGTGCKTTKPINTGMLQDVPTAYGPYKDSTNSAMLAWNNYFNDTLLVKLIDAGLRSNLNVLMAAQRLEMSAAELNMTKGALFPSVTANAAYLQRKFGLYTMDGAGNITTDILPGRIVPVHLPDYYFGLQTSWEVDVWGKLRNKRRAALARYLSGSEGRNLVITNLVAQLAHAYYELIALDNELDVIRKTVDVQTKALELVTTQKQAAATNQLVVTQFKAQLLNSQALEYETLQKITEFEARVNVLLGRFPQPVSRNETVFNQPITLHPSVGVPFELLRNRPDIRKAELEVVASKADVKAARAAFYPSLTISGGVGLQAFDAGLLFQTPQSLAYSILGNLAAPLINRSAIRANFKTANARQIESLYNYQETILNGYAEVNNEVMRIKNLEKIVALKTEEVTVLNQSIDISSELFKMSRANYLEVLMTQKNSLAARLELLETKRRQYHAVVDLYKALGGGWR
jgi:outer membrane protein, multidrug efflux system